MFLGGLTMPRIADEHLHERILDEGHRLWRRQGEKGLTLRAVAQATGTTTTTVYKRFRSKRDLLAALAERVRQNIAAEVTAASTLEESCRRYLGFAEKHALEYQLLFGPLWADVMGPGSPRQIRAWLLKGLAKRFGGEPQDYEHIFWSLFFLLQGAASLLAATPRRKANAEIRRNCIAACDALLGSVRNGEAGKRKSRGIK